MTYEVAQPTSELHTKTQACFHRTIGEKMEQKRFVAMEEGIRALRTERNGKFLRVWVLLPNIAKHDIGDVIEGLLVPKVGLLCGVILGKIMNFVGPEDHDLLKLKDGQEFKGKVIENDSTKIVLMLPADGTLTDGRRRTLTATVDEIATLSITEIPMCCFDFDPTRCEIKPTPAVRIKPGDELKVSIDGSIVRATAGEKGKLTIPGIFRSFSVGSTLWVLEANGKPTQGILELGAW